MRLEFLPYNLNFKQPAGTSRGILTEKITCLLKLFEESDPSRFGIGEAAVFPGLSPEADSRYFDKLMELVVNVRLGRPTDLSRFPSLQFGFEQAINDFASGGRGLYFPSEFTKGNQTIEINGLVWMGDYEIMKQRIQDILDKGFKCVKLKIGAIDWDKELDLIRYIRSSHNSDNLEIRVDANGGFTPEIVMNRLEALARYQVSSIEQPLKAGNVKEMCEICKVSPVPIALDEELIGKFTLEDKERIIDSIMPHAIVLKPALCGGFSGAAEWIRLAGERNIGWWITSALESNVGLNAIAQWTSTLAVKIPQGLGTGSLFTNNFQSPLRLEGDRLSFDPSAMEKTRRQFESLEWRGL